MTYAVLEHFIRVVYDHVDSVKRIDEQELAMLELLGDRTLHLGHMLTALEECYALVRGLDGSVLSQEQRFEIRHLQQVLCRLLTIHGVRVPDPR
jgi:hypothetical protein